MTDHERLLAALRGETHRGLLEAADGDPAYDDHQEMLDTLRGFSTTNKPKRPKAPRRVRLTEQTGGFTLITEGRP